MTTHANYDARRLKAILLKLRGPDDQGDDELEIVPAPDGGHAVVFSHGWEMTMMNWSHCFTLVDRSLKVVEKFDGLSAIRRHCAWSSDSAQFAVAGSEWGGLLLWQVARKAFTIVRTTGRQFCFEFAGPARLRIWFDPEQLRVMNIAPGGKIARLYRAPAEAVLDTAALEWRPRAGLARIVDAARKAPVVPMTAIENSP